MCTDKGKQTKSDWFGHCHLGCCYGILSDDGHSNAARVSARKCFEKCHDNWTR